MYLSVKNGYHWGLVTNKTTDESFLGQTCQNEEKVYGEETYLAE